MELSVSKMGYLCTIDQTKLIPIQENFVQTRPTFEIVAALFQTQITVHTNPKEVKKRKIILSRG